MNTYFFRQRGAAFVAIALLLLFAAACVNDPGMILLSMREAGTTDDGLDYGPEDIIAITDEGSGPEWFTFFDGSEHGLTAQHALNGFSFNEYMVPLDDPLDIPPLFLSFRANRVRVPGISGWVYGQDIVAYSEPDASDPGTFEMFMDGSDVFLTTASEKVDSIGVWLPESYPDPSYEEECPAGIVFISTQGLYRVKGGFGGQIVGNGFDVLLFCAQNLGADTVGDWYRVFNERDFGAFSPGRASSSIDVLYFEADMAADLAAAPASADPDLGSGIVFAFTPRTAFGFNWPGESRQFLPSQLYILAAENGEPFEFDGPLADFNAGIDYSTDPEEYFPPVNGIVSGLSVVDFPFGAPPPP